MSRTPSAMVGGGATSTLHPASKKPLFFPKAFITVEIDKFKVF